MSRQVKLAVSMYVGDFDQWTVQQAEHANRKYPGCEPSCAGLNHLMRTWWLLEKQPPPQRRLRNLQWALAAMKHPGKKQA